MKKQPPPSFRDKFTGKTLDGWIEAGKSTPLDTWQDAKQAADAMNEHIKFVIEEPLTGAKLGEFEIKKELRKTDITGPAGIEYPKTHLEKREEELKRFLGKKK